MNQSRISTEYSGITVDGICCRSVYSNLGLTKLQYIVRRLCSDEKEKVTV